MPIHLLPDRREVLAGFVAGGAALALGRPAAAVPRDGESAWFALIADTHIAAGASTRVHGQCMADNWRAVIADILARESRPRGVFVAGDLAFNDGQRGDYRRWLALAEPLRAAGLPLHLALGNHDDRDRFRAELEIPPSRDEEVADKHVADVAGPGLRFVVLDSLDRVNVAPGRLGERQLAWLARHLDADPRTPAVVVVHHNPAGPLLLDRHAPLGLTDTAALLAVLRPRRQVKAVVFGHTHHWDVRAEDGLHRVNLPAVAYPFTTGEPLGWCRLVPDDDGARLELRCTGGDRSQDGRRIRLRWRPL